MKVIVGLGLLVLASATSTAVREDENGERKRKLAQISDHMSRHLRRDGGEFSLAAPARAMRHNRESDRASRGLEASAAKENKSMHAEKIRRVAEHMGQHHREHLQAQGPMAPELRQVHAAQHSLASMSKPKREEKPAVDEATATKTQEKKRSMQELARQMSRTFDPSAVRNHAAVKGAPGADKSEHGARVIKQAASHAASARQNKMNKSHFMDMQHKMAQTAHQTFSADHTNGKGDGESEQANDGDE